MESQINLKLLSYKTIKYKQTWHLLVKKIYLLSCTSVASSLCLTVKSQSLMLDSTKLEVAFAD